MSHKFANLKTKKVAYKYIDSVSLNTILYL